MACPLRGPLDAICRFTPPPSPSAHAECSALSSAEIGAAAAILALVRSPCARRNSGVANCARPRALSRSIVSWVNCLRATAAPALAVIANAGDTSPVNHWRTCCPRIAQTARTFARFEVCSGATSQLKAHQNQQKLRRILERAKGFEPSTPTLARSCSTPELHPHPMGMAAEPPRPVPIAKSSRVLQPRLKLG
jgi:hypothetical protein